MRSCTRRASASKKTPSRAPVANCYIERWIGGLRRELLDRNLIWNENQLRRLVVDYLNHYNQHRPHRSLGQQPPCRTQPGELARQRTSDPIGVLDQRGQHELDNRHGRAVWQPLELTLGRPGDAQLVDLASWAHSAA